MAGLGPIRLSRVHSQKRFTSVLVIDKISEVDGADDDIYVDPAVSSETDGVVEEQQYMRSASASARQGFQAFRSSAPEICKSLTLLIGKGP